MTAATPSFAALCASYSRYAANWLHAYPDLAGHLQRIASMPVTRAWIEQRLAELCAQLGGMQTLAQACTSEVLKKALRRLRAEVFCAVMARDLAGVASLDEVTGTFSDLAEVAIQQSLQVLTTELEESFGAPLNQASVPQTLGVIGMGKLGGRELNVSSDIDLIFVYGEDGETAGGKRSALSNQEFFTRLGRRLINLLDDVTEDGYVFRVDMRLRPNGESGPLVCSLAMLEEYFYVQGREWERYAWIKSRLVSATDNPAGQRLAQQLEKLTTPFIYRRYLDYGVIDALRSLHRQIRQQAQRRASLHTAQIDDIKLGRGGIREIEFNAQVFQLIRGGQDVAFRIHSTRQVLQLAAQRGLLSAAACTALCDAYVLLRQLEHRLQYLDDVQTHVLPADPPDCLKLAHSLGYADYASFMAVLDWHREHVAAQFEQMFSDKNEVLAADSGSRGESSLQQDFPLPELLAQRLDGIRASGRYQNLPERSRQRFDQLIHSAVRIVMQQITRTPLRSSIGPHASQLLPEEREIAPTMIDETLVRFLDLLEAISRRSAYLALLCEYPVALERVLAVLGSSRWAARYLNAHPQLLDELLDDEALAAPLDISAFRQRLRQRLEKTDGVEQRMDSLRHAHQAEVFQILLRDLAGQLTVETVSDRLSELADAILDATLQAAWNALPARLKYPAVMSGDLPKFAIIAYGKLGGKELGYISDLDLIFLYDDPAENAAERYAALARRLITWLTSATGAGVLFDIDLRLRPSGASGLLVTSLQAFREYQLQSGAADVAAANTAWVWEHQALTRARFSAGDRALGAAFEAIRAEVMRQRRDAAALAQEIVTMRARMSEGHVNRSTLFDLKHDRGGMIDIEFIVQYLILLHAHAHPCLIGNTGNINLLRELANLNLLNEQEAQQAGDAYRIYRALQHRFRLEGEELARVEPAQVAQERLAVLQLWERVLGENVIFMIH